MFDDLESRIQMALLVRRATARTIRDVMTPDEVLVEEIRAELIERERLVAVKRGRERAGRSQPAALTARNLVKKAVLIKSLRDRWVGIESDLSNGSRNGLSAAAAAPGRRGYYDEDAAIEWARRAGKMPADDVSRVHRLR